MSSTNYGTTTMHHVRSLPFLLLLVGTLTTANGQGVSAGDSGRYIGPARTSADGVTLRSPFFLAVTLEYPTLTRFTTHDGFPVAPFADTCCRSWNSSLRPGYRVGMLGGMYLGRESGFRGTLGINAGQLRQQIVYRDRFRTPSNASDTLRQQVDIDVNIIRVSALIQFELMSHARRPLPDTVDGESSQKSREWLSLVVSGGVAYSLYTGAAMRSILLNLDDEIYTLFTSAGEPRGEERRVILYDSQLPDTKSSGIELRGGIDLEFPLGSEFFGAVGLQVGTAITDLGPEWRYTTLGLRGQVGW